MAVSQGVGYFSSTRSRTLEELAKPAEGSGLLEKLGGVLARGKAAAKETLRVAGRTVKQNADLILFTAMYVSEVAIVAMFSFDAVYHPERFPVMAEYARPTLQQAYVATAVAGAALAVPQAMIVHNKFTTGNVFGIR